MTASPDDRAADSPAPGDGLLERAHATAAGPHPAEAVALYRELLAAEPAHVEALLRLAGLLARLDEHEQALGLLSEALRHAPDQTELLVLRGGINGHLRRYEDAEADLRRVLRLHPSHAQAHLELGQVLWRRASSRTRPRTFARRSSSSRTTRWTYAHLGNALNQAGDLAGARMALERAVQLDPRDAKAHHLLGRVYDRLGYPDEARAMYQRSRELTGA